MNLAPLRWTAITLCVGGLVACSGSLQRPASIDTQTESAPPHPLPGELSRGHVLMPINGRATAQLIATQLQAGGNQQSFSSILDRLKMFNQPPFRAMDQTAIYFNHRQCAHADGLADTVEVNSRVCSSGASSYRQMIFTPEDHTFEIGDFRVMLANAGYRASLSPIRFPMLFERRPVLYSLFLRGAKDPIVVVSHLPEDARSLPQIQHVYVFWPDENSIELE